MKAIYLLIPLVLALVLFPKHVAQFAGGLVVVLLFLWVVFALFRPLFSTTAEKSKKGD